MSTGRETVEQRARRNEREAQYRARKLASDPVAFRAMGVDRARRWRATNPTSAKAARRRWREKNRDRYNATYAAWRAANVLRHLLIQAKSKAKTRGIEFSVQMSDLPPMGDRCPLLGTPWPPASERNGLTSPSVDRIDSSKGYVPGNVWIVSRRGNTIKSNGTAAEHEAIAAAMRRVGAT